MSENAPEESNRDRRRERASGAIDIGMEDPYWLYNLKGPSVKTGDLLQMAEELREDAAALETAHGKIENGDWTSEEAALYIAANANFGDYDTHDHLYDSIPITEDENG